MGKLNNGNRKYFEQATLLDGPMSNYDGPQNSFAKGVNGALDMIRDERELSLYREGRLIPKIELIQPQLGPVVYDQAGRTMAMDPEYMKQHSGGFKLPSRILGMDKSMFLVLTGVVAVLIFMELFQRKH